MNNRICRFFGLHSVLLVGVILLLGCVTTQSSMQTAPILSNDGHPVGSVVIEGPEYVENPNVVPMFVKIQPPLRDGDVLNLYIDNKLAYTIQPSGEVGLSFFSGRVRSMSGRLHAVVLRGNGRQDQTSLSLRQDIASYIPDVSDRGTQFMEHAAPGEFRALFKNYMGAQQYIGRIFISTSRGDVQVGMTPYVSMNPFVWIQGNFSDASVRGVTLSEADERAAPQEVPRTREVERVSTGTGWYSEFGLFVTNDHVVTNAQEVIAVRHDGFGIPVEIVARDRDSDLLLLSPIDRSTVEELKGIPVSREIESLGSDVFTIGFPITGVLGVSPRLTNGIISAATGIGDDHRYYQITVPLQPGNSGGPLINSKGEAVGVVTATLDALEMARSTGAIPQNVNFAVKASHVDDLSVGIRGNIDVVTHPAEQANLEILANRIQSSIVLIVARSRER